MGIASDDQTTAWTTDDESSKNMEAVLEVVDRLGQAKSADETIDVALATIRRAFEWDYGSFWRLHRDENLLRFAQESGTVSPQFRTVTIEASFARGVGLSGTTWAENRLVFVPDLAEVTDCCRAPAAKEAGVQSGVCFPITREGSLIGTMDFFATRRVNLSPQRHDVLESVGKLVSSSLDRFAELERSAEATENARAISQVLQAVTEASTPEDVAVRALNEVRSAFGWAYGSYWKIDPQVNELRFCIDSGTVTPDFHQATATASFQKGVGLSGRTWATEDLFFVEDLGQIGAAGGCKVGGLFSDSNRPPDRWHDGLLLDRSASALSGTAASASGCRQDDLAGIDANQRTTALAE